MILIAIGLVLSAAQVLPAYPMASASCNFSLAVSPTSNTVARGAAVVFGISIKSSCGYDHIGWGAFVSSPTPTTTCTKQGVCTSNGPLITQSSYHTIGSGSSTFRVDATSDTLLTTWTITVSASDVTHCCVSHSETVALTVDDFTVTANPTSLKVSAGQTAVSTITAAAQNGFSGAIYWSVTIQPSTTFSGDCNLQPYPVTLSSTVTSATATLSCAFPSGAYTVTVSGAPYNGLPVRSATVTISVT